VLNQESKLYFLHIPKTAGTSIRYWLWDAFAVEDFLECHHPQDLEAADSSQLEKARFYSGHFGPSLWARLGNRPTTLTFLREPVAQVRSMIRYVRGITEEEARLFIGTWVSPLLLVRREGFSSLFGDRSAIDAFSNMQVRSLALSRDFPALSDLPAATGAMYDHARRTLETLDAVGVVERMPESLLLIAGQLGWPPRALSYRLNETPASAEEADAVLRDNEDVIREANSWDLKLYDFGHDLFEEQLGALRLKLGLNGRNPKTKTLEINALRSALLDRFLDSPLTRPALRRGRLTQGAGLFLDGWEERFLWPPVKRWLRWAASKGKSTLYLPLLRAGRPIAARFEFFYFRDESILKGLEIQVDGDRAPIVHSDVKEDEDINFHVCEIEVPALRSDAAMRWTVISFLVPEKPATDIAVTDGGKKNRPFALGNIDLL
jgi:hypothetical protein